MMGWGWGMGAGGWIAMVIFWVAVLALIVWAVMRVFPAGGARGSAPRVETPQEILDRRFAAGEIDSETYRAMRVALDSGRVDRELS
ncbi:SHOCT domain-containing protein [Cellulomonas fimi]|nr:SHOCT domain-containing protein [Cellulomonas fimi]